MIAAIRLIASIAIAAPSQPAAPISQDAVLAARAFLDAFAADPQSTRKLVTNDALFVFIDMGGPYKEVLRALRNRKPMTAGCSLDSLNQTGAPTAAELGGMPSESLSSPGNFATLEAVYSCMQVDGGIGHIDINLVMKDGLMAMFFLVPRRKDDGKQAED